MKHAQGCGRDADQVAGSLCGDLIEGTTEACAVFGRLKFFALSIRLSAWKALQTRPPTLAVQGRWRRVTSGHSADWQPHGSHRGANLQIARPWLPEEGNGSLDRFRANLDF